LIGFSLDGTTSQEEAGRPKDATKIIRNIEKRTGMPAPEYIIRFLRIILDSFFLQLLQVPEALSVLQRLQDKVNEYAGMQRKLESLRGPLEPFAKLLSLNPSGSTPQKPEPSLPTRPMPLKQYQIEQLVL